MYNFYTTKMAGEKKDIVERFANIVSYRKKSRRVTVIATVVMALFAGTAVFAAGAVNYSQNGFEVFEQNEAYSIGGYRFSFNINGTNAPEWARELAGESGELTISMDEYWIHGTDGWMHVEREYKIMGDNGERPMYRTYKVVNYTDEGSRREPGWEIWTHALYIDYNEYKNDDANENPDIIIRQDLQWQQVQEIKVIFFDKERDIEYEAFQDGDGETAYIEWMQPNYFITAYDYSEYGDDYTRNAEKYSSGAKQRSKFFAPYEDNYQNRKVSGIDIEILSATEEDGITIKYENSFDDLELFADVYDENMSLMMGIDPTSEDQDGNKRYLNYVLDGSIRIPNAEYALEDSEEALAGDKFISGKTYRVEMGLADENGNIVYRWLDYVTVE